MAGVLDLGEVSTRVQRGCPPPVAGGSTTRHVVLIREAEIHVVGVQRRAARSPLAEVARSPGRTEPDEQAGPPDLNPTWIHVNRELTHRPTAVTPCATTPRVAVRTSAREVARKAV